MIEYITYIWQMGVGSGIWRFQTDDPRIARKLLRTKGWLLIDKHFDKRDIWLFQKEFYKPQDARKKLMSLTGVSKLEKGENPGEYYSKTYADTTLEK